MLDSRKIKTPGTDEWFLQRLSKDMGNRIPQIDLLTDWYGGEPPLAVPDGGDAVSFQRVIKASRLNLAELIVNAVLFRMNCLAFRTAADNDQNGDAEAAKIYRRNKAKVQITQALEWMLITGHAYILTGSRQKKGKVLSVFTAEHPRLVITEEDPSRPGISIAGLKVYRDDLRDRDVAVLYRRIEDGDGNTIVYSRTAVKKGRTLLPARGRAHWKINGNDWDWDQQLTGIDEVTQEPYWQDSYEEYDLELIPIHYFRNRNGMGEFEKHLPTMERINHTILQRMIIIAFQAFRQRGIKGMPNEDDDGNEIDYSDVFSSDPGSLWLLPDAADFWESGQADIGPVLNAAKDDIIQLAVASSTPLFSVVPDAANGSAEGAALQREGLLFKTGDLIDRVDRQLAEMMAQCFEIEGDDVRSEVEGVETIWGSPRRSSLQERAIAGVQARAAGVPWRTRMEKFLELTPDEIATAEQERLSDQFTFGTDEEYQSGKLPGVSDFATGEQIDSADGGSNTNDQS